ncbi:beta family protein [Shewanella algae]|uniref:beta family protein n=1 Tax=Shewanella algae TaxID=38313 RepID=UPI0031F50E0C
MTPEEIKSTIIKGVRKHELNFKDSNSFYLDDYDLKDSLRIDGDIVYNFVINAFKDVVFIPVVGINRTPKRIKSVSSKLIQSETIAIRVDQEDFSSYEVNKDYFEDLFDSISDKYKKYHLIIDCRLCLNIDTNLISDRAIKFILDISENYDFEEIIVTGSSIPAGINEIMPVNSKRDLTRNECMIYKRVQKALGDKVTIGDYTTVSPDYSDADIPKNAMRKVMTPKVIYPYGLNQYFLRGAALETHPRGTKQYDDMCLELTKMPFFRKEAYSAGDAYLVSKAKGIGVDAQPHSIGKHLINAHITFMLHDF